MRYTFNCLVSILLNIGITGVVFSGHALGQTVGQQDQLQTQTPILDVSKHILEGGVEQQVLVEQSTAFQRQDGLEGLWKKYYDAAWQENLRGNVSEAWKNFSLALEIAEKFPQGDTKRTMTLSGLAAVYTTNHQYAEAQQIMARLGYSQGVAALQAQQATSGYIGSQLKANAQDNSFRLRGSKLNAATPAMRFLGVGRRPCPCHFFHPTTVAPGPKFPLPSPGVLGLGG